MAKTFLKLIPIRYNYILKTKGQAMTRLLTLLLLTTLYLNALPLKMQADRYLLQAKNSIQNKDYYKAKSYFEKILALNIQVPNDLNYFYGKTLLQTGDYTKALHHLDAFLSNGGDKTKHYVNALDMYTKAEEEKAKVEAKKAAVYTVINGYMWQDQYYTRNERGAYLDYNYGKAQNWQGAKNYCQNLDLAGHSDWYLPSKSQLKSLYNNKSQLKNNRSGLFWSSTKRDNSGAWNVFFDVGYTYSYSKSFVYYVRCVRRGQ